MPSGEITVNHSLQAPFDCSVTAAIWPKLQTKCIIPTIDIQLIIHFHWTLL